MTEILQTLEPAKKRLYKNTSAQTVTANLLFPLLLVIPGVKLWVAANPEAYVSVQAVLNVVINFVREKLK